ncbi:MAG: TetR/AcrR family transcriptional regulator [Pseudomonadota bacterium]
MQNSGQDPRPDPATAVRARGRPRGRPRAFDREAALAEATRLFWRKGYEATSIADLTAVMGIGSPSLYAAFGSKEALYVEAVRHYGDRYEALVWSRFQAAPTARAAVEAFLIDSAGALTGSVADNPPGCMVTLASVGDDEHRELGQHMRCARAAGLQRLEDRFRRAQADGDLPASSDLHALARFVQTVQSGMSILARDGAGRDELEAVARMALAGWDAQVGA